MSEFKSVKASHGGNGWGGPLIITPTAEKPYVLSVTLGWHQPGRPSHCGAYRCRGSTTSLRDPIETDQAWRRCHRLRRRGSLRHLSQDGP